MIGIFTLTKHRPIGLEACIWKSRAGRQVVVGWRQDTCHHFLPSLHAIPSSRGQSLSSCLRPSESGAALPTCRREMILWDFLPKKTYSFLWVYHTVQKHKPKPNAETKWIERCSTHTTCCSHASPGAKHGSKEPSSASLLQQWADTKEWGPPRESLPAACCPLTHPCETIIKFLILNCYILECLSQTTDNQNTHSPIWRTTEVGLKCTAHPSCLDSHPTRMFLLASHGNLVGLDS